MRHRADFIGTVLACFLFTTLAAVRVKSAEMRSAKKNALWWASCYCPGGLITNHAASTIINILEPTSAARNMRGLKRRRASKPTLGRLIATDTALSETVWEQLPRELPRAHGLQLVQDQHCIRLEDEGGHAFTHSLRPWLPVAMYILLLDPLVNLQISVGLLPI